MLFLIELSGTLGHLSLSIKEVSADGTIMPMSASFASFSGWYPVPITSPLRHRCANLILFIVPQCLSLPEDHDLPDKLHCFLPANMNKQHYVFSWGRELGEMNQKPLKNNCLPSAYQPLDNHSRAGCKENRWCVSTNDMGFLHSQLRQSCWLACSDTQPTTKWQAERNGAGDSRRWTDRCVMVSKNEQCFKWLLWRGNAGNRGVNRKKGSWFQDAFLSMVPQPTGYWASPCSESFHHTCLLSLVRTKISEKASRVR